MTEPIKHLRRDGTYARERDRGRPYTVRVQFPNPNADYDLNVTARSRQNAVWVAAERLIGTGASIGPIRPGR